MELKIIGLNFLYAVVAPDVPRWRYEETLSYVDRIEANLARMDDQGRVVK